MDKRHFTVVIGSKEHGLYISSKPSSAAKKAVSKLCASNKSKKVEFSLREITQGSKKKTYGPYLGEMKKLKKPIELKGRVIRHEIKLHLKKGKNLETTKKMRGGENNQVEFKKLCQEAKKAARKRGHEPIAGSELIISSRGLDFLDDTFDDNKLREYHALFIRNEKSFSTKEILRNGVPTSYNIRMIKAEEKKNAVENFLKNLDSNKSIDQNVKDAWRCVMYNAFQNLQTIYPRESTKLPNVELIKVHGFVNELKKPARYDESGLKEFVLPRQ
jgi:hypothetical protein